MTREQQTAIILGALIILTVIFGYARPAPDFSTMSDYQRCEHRQWYADHGGSEDACKNEVLDDASRRLSRGY